MSRWPVRSLGEILTLEYGKSLPEPERRNGPCLVVGSNGIQGSHDTAIVKAPGIVVGRKGSVGQVNMYDKDFWPIDTTYYVVQKADLNQKWLYHALKTLPLPRLSTATGVPGLNRNDVYQLSVSVPPRSEQERIVRILEEADQLRRLRADADYRSGDLCPAMFHQMFEAIDQREPAKHPLEQICVSPGGIKAGPFGSSLKKESYTSHGPRVYGQEQVIAGDFAVGDYHISQVKYEEMVAYSVLPGDVLISLVGTFGKTAIVPWNVEPGIINPRLIRIRVDRRKALPEFLSHCLEAQVTQAELQAFAHGQTMGVLNAGLLKKVLVPVPSLDQQRIFVASATGVNRMRVAQAASRRRLDDLFQSILHKAFQGEL